MEDKNIADMLRMTSASMVELFNRIADHIEQLQHKVKDLEEKAAAKDRNDKVS